MRMAIWVKQLSFPTFLLACLAFAIPSAMSGPAASFPAPKISAPATNPHLTQTSVRRDRIVEKLRSQGFTKIEFQGRRLFGYVLHACRDGQLYRIAFDPLTVERSRRTLGDCLDRVAGARVDTEEVRRLLRDAGYYQIRFFDDKLPRYGVYACLDGNEWRFVIGRAGRVIEERQRGACPGTGAGGSNVTAADVRSSLQQLGFYRIRMISRDMPPTKVEACKAGRLYEINLTRSGRIMNRSHTGNCSGADQLPANDLRAGLERRGYYGIQLVRERPDRVVYDACRGNRKFRLRLDKTGHVIGRSLEGWCDVRPVQYYEADGRILDHFPSGQALNPEDCDDYLGALLARTRIRFQTNSAEISNRSERLLEDVGHIMNQCPDTTIEVAGHTDSRGSEELNLQLSKERARSVVRYLVRKQGVSRDRLRPVGYGESYPIADNNTERGQRRNRRIEMVVLWGT